MKQILKDEVVPIQDRVGQWVAMVARSIFDKNKMTGYRLEHDPICDGWVFKVHKDPQWGHSGHHKRRDDACYRAFYASPDATIVEFPTKEERDDWLNTL